MVLYLYLMGMPCSIAWRLPLPREMALALGRRVPVLVLDTEEKGEKGAALLRLLTLRPPTKRGGRVRRKLFFPNGSPSKVGMDYGLDRRRCNSVACHASCLGAG